MKPRTIACGDLRPGDLISLLRDSNAHVLLVVGNETSKSAQDVELGFRQFTFMWLWQAGKPHVKLTSACHHVDSHNFYLLSRP